jgi:hypothetical protein
VIVSGTSLVAILDHFPCFASIGPIGKFVSQYESLMTKFEHMGSSGAAEQYEGKNGDFSTTATLTATRLIPCW